MEIVPQDALEKLRDALGEDPMTGLVPVEVVVGPAVRPKAPEEPPEEVELKTVDPEKSKFRLGRIPCEALYWILYALVGRNWWFNEWEVVIEDVAKAGYFIDGPGHAKVMALWSLLRAPHESVPFYTRWDAFLFLTCAMMGRPVKWGEFAVPTPLECAFAVDIALELRPRGFSKQVEGTIASCAIHHGMWCMVGALRWVQPAVLEHMRYFGIAIGQKDVEEVTRRVLELLHDKKTSDDAPDPDEEGLDEREEIHRVQVVRVLDHLERIHELTSRAEAARDAVLDRFKDKFQEDAP